MINPFTLNSNHNYLCKNNYQSLTNLHRHDKIHQLKANNPFKKQIFHNRPHSSHKPYYHSSNLSNSICRSRVKLMELQKTQWKEEIEHQQRTMLKYGGPDALRHYIPNNQQETSILDGISQYYSKQTTCTLKQSNQHQSNTKYPLANYYSSTNTNNQPTFPTLKSNQQQKFKINQHNFDCKYLAKEPTLKQSSKYDYYDQLEQKPAINKKIQFKDQFYSNELEDDNQWKSPILKQNVGLNFLEFDSEDENYNQQKIPSIICVKGKIYNKIQV